MAPESWNSLLCGNRIFRIYSEPDKEEVEDADKTQSNTDISELREWVEEHINDLKVVCNQRQKNANTFRGKNPSISNGAQKDGESDWSFFDSVDVVEEETLN